MDASHSFLVLVAEYFVLLFLPFRTTGLKLLSDDSFLLYSLTLRYQEKEESSLLSQLNDPRFSCSVLQLILGFHASGVMCVPSITSVSWSSAWR